MVSMEFLPEWVATSTLVAGCMVASVHSRLLNWGKNIFQQPPNVDFFSSVFMEIQTVNSSILELYSYYSFFHKFIHFSSCFMKIIFMKQLCFTTIELYYCSEAKYLFIATFIYMPVIHKFCVYCIIDYSHFSFDLEYYFFFNKFSAIISACHINSCQDFKKQQRLIIFSVSTGIT